MNPLSLVNVPKFRAYLSWFRGTIEEKHFLFPLYKAEVSKLKRCHHSYDLTDKCGTVGCIAGWLGSYPEFKGKKITDFAALSDFINKDLQRGDLYKIIMSLLSSGNQGELIKWVKLPICADSATKDEVCDMCEIFCAACEDYQKN